MRLAVYTVTKDRCELTQKSFDMLRRWGGIEFDHFVFDNASEDNTPQYLEQYEPRYLYCSKVNYGQNIAANHLLDEIEKLGGYEWIMRWDNDAIPRTRRVIKKLVRLADDLRAAGEYCVMSPRILRLKHPPEPLDKVQWGSYQLEIVDVLGGICRLHPAEFFEEWRFNQYGAMGFGEALEVADRCSENRMGMVRYVDIKVEHAHGEDGQKQRFPAYFTWERKEVPKYVGFGL